MKIYACILWGRVYTEKSRKLSAGNRINRFLQGRVQFPTGGTARERTPFRRKHDSVELRGRQYSLDEKESGESQKGMPLCLIR